MEAIAVLRRGGTNTRMEGEEEEGRGPTSFVQFHDFGI